MLFSRLQKPNLRNKIIISLTGFVIIFFCLICFIVVPTIRDIKTMGQEIEAQRVDLEKKYIKGYNLKQLSDNLKKIQPKLNLLDQIFINKNRELEFITTMESQANNSQVEQKMNLSSTQATENPEFQKSNLQLFVEGKFNKLLKYLLNLESLSYYINVKSLEFTPTSGGERVETSDQESSTASNQTNNINMFINADIYWK